MTRLAILVTLVGLVAAAGAAAQPAAKLPNGVFRTTITDRDLVAGHAPDVRQNHGTYTLTLRNSSWRLVQKAPNPVLVPVATGIYTGTGTVVRFTIGTPAKMAGFSIHAVWRFDGKALLFSRVGDDPDARVVFSAHPWRKIG